MHFPFLTVEQTIDFALSCKFDIPKGERDQIRNELLREFGLSHVLKTIVGNDFSVVFLVVSVNVFLLLKRLLLMVPFIYGIILQKV